MGQLSSRQSEGSHSQKKEERKEKEVADNTKLPRDWASFLKDLSNKLELFHFLSEKINGIRCPEDKCMYITQGENVLPSSPLNVMEKCNHEEADTRILVHIKDAISKGAKNVLVRTVDTDVIVLLVGHFHELKSLQSSLLVWVAFGMGKSFRHYSINAICDHIGEQKWKGLPIFHAFTRCDTNSSFYGKGKKLCWAAWNCLPDITETFLFSQDHPFEPLEKGSPQFEMLERFTIVIYDKISSLRSVSYARRELFTNQTRNVECIAPTR